jgi:cell division protein FtsL
MGFLDDINKESRFVSQLKSAANKFNVNSAMLESLKKALPIPNTNFKSFKPLMTSLKPPKLYNKELFKSLKDERNAINSIITDIYYNIAQINLLKKQVEKNPESSPLVNFSIAISIALIILCIALPLLAMPSDNSFNFINFSKHLFDNLISVKGFFVILLTGLVCSIFVVFGIKNHRMKYSQNDIKALEEYTKLENYSEYLKNYVENTTDSSK